MCLGGGGLEVWCRKKRVFCVHQQTGDKVASSSALHAHNHPSLTP